MPQQHLEASVYSADVYQTNFQPMINAWSSPVCPGTFDGETQYYDVNTGKCINLPRSAFTPEALARGSGKCAAGMPHGGPFMMEVNGNCYRTNDCPTSSYLDDQCLDTQQIPVRPNPFACSGFCGPCTRQ